MESSIIRFYRNAGTDHAGRGLEEILGWDNGLLESVHDYIQWLFPLDEPSGFNADAPLLTETDRRAFRDDADLAAALRRAFARMMAFYGFCLIEEGGNTKVARTEDWPVRSRDWMRPRNHNYLRLTRIMKSVALLGSPALARALRERLTREYQEAPDLIGATTLRYWQTAGGTNEEVLSSNF